MKIKMPEFLKPFLYSGGKFQPVFFWISVLMLSVTIFQWTKFVFCIIAFIKNPDPNMISDMLIISMMGQVIVWAGVYNWYKIKTPEIPTKSPVEGIAETAIAVVENIKRAKK